MKKKQTTKKDIKEWFKEGSTVYFISYKGIDLGWVVDSGKICDISELHSGMGLVGIRIGCYFEIHYKSVFSDYDIAVVEAIKNNIEEVEETIKNNIEKVEEAISNLRKRYEVMKSSLLRNSDYFLSKPLLLDGPVVSKHRKVVK